MSIPTREEFLSEVFSFGNAMESQGANYYLRTRSSPDAEATEVIAAYDAALARIAELERHITGLHCNAIEAMLPTIPKVPGMIGLESSGLFPEEKP